MHPIPWTVSNALVTRAAWGAALSTTYSIGSLSLNVESFARVLYGRSHSPTATATIIIALEVLSRTNHIGQPGGAVQPTGTPIGTHGMSRTIHEGAKGRQRPGATIWTPRDAGEHERPQKIVSI
ncbi:uncharacterized protein B0T15DRAFT_531235 [Chaetomium strumarium]|uniref:Uncharacterized protein n=1 Tax=Chaetomium strumarium TaxID=1170767 RepID=A0AAJ0GSH2_9PEZI|nr:hypothetical protein B0T15DRAFT_531235 [Chaetomium strumarium]